MLVVATRDNFIAANEENRPGTNLIADAVRLPHPGFHDFGHRRNLQADEPDGCITDDQQELHPDGSMSEQGKEDLDDSKFRTRERRAPGIMKIAVVDQIPAQRAGRRDITFNDVHAELPTSPIARRPDSNAPGQTFELTLSRISS